jgi:hypothetical protein
MCRIPKVVIVAPVDRQNELRRALSSLEYDVSGTVASADDAASIPADVAVVFEPDEDTLLRLRELGLKTVALGGDAASADMRLGNKDAASFKNRIWELFRPT